MPRGEVLQLKHEVNALQTELEMLQERLNYQDKDLETIQTRRKPSRSKFYQAWKPGGQPRSHNRFHRARFGRGLQRQ